MSEKSNSDDVHASDEHETSFLMAWKQDLIDCLGFFSRLPVPPMLGQISAGMPKMKRTARALPLIGLLLAMVALVPATLFDALALTSPLPSLLLAMVTVTTMIVITGGLHEDGLADVADGFWGGHTIARKLEIMKDSRLGSYGALALLMSVGMRVSILGYLFENYGVHVGGIAYLAMASVSRLPILYVWHTLPPARLNGLSASVGQPSSQSYGIAVALGAVLTSILVVPNFGLLSALSAFVLMVLSCLLVVSAARKHIKGQTGDVLGASQQIGEAAFGIGLLLFASAG